jgi:hypothetical protein
LEPYFWPILRGFSIAILDQLDVLCVYVAIGQKTSTVAEMISGLARTKDMSSVVIVLSGADEALTCVPRWELRAPIPGGALRLGIQPHVPISGRCVTGCDVGTPE